MNFFRIKIFIISILFSVNVLASPFGFFKNLTRWKERQQVRRAGVNLSFYDDVISSLSKNERKQILDILEEGRNNTKYDHVYFHLEEQPGWLEYLGTENFKDAVDRFIYITNDEHRLRDFSDELWENSMYRHLFYELWEMDLLKHNMIGFISRKHLLENTGFLLDWWRYAGSRNLIIFMHSSLLELPGGFQKFWVDHPFGRTVLKATRDDKDFGREVQSIVNFLERGVREGTEQEQALQQILERGRVNSLVVPEKVIFFFNKLKKKA